MIRRRAQCLIMLAAGCSALATGVAAAEPASGSAVKDASKHFTRGVVLYNETDYRAALVEFRRAYEVAPNAAVLYNIGQTYYQLQNYAAALVTLERYITESGSTAPHRREVEQTIETLQARVGKVAVTTNIADCEITVDDELVGRSPLNEPILVSIGRRKITAMRVGRPAETRFVDVAAGDTVKLSLSLTDPNASPGSDTGSSSPWARQRWINIGLPTTAALGVGAITAGVFGYLASRDLQNERGKFGVSRDELDKKGSRVATLSVTADILGVAALVTGGVTLKLILSQSKSGEVHVAVAPNGIRLAGTFQ